MSLVEGSNEAFKSAILSTANCQRLCSPSLSRKRSWIQPSPLFNPAQKPASMATEKSSSVRWMRSTRCGRDKRSKNKPIHWTDSACSSQTDDARPVCGELMLMRRLVFGTPTTMWVPTIRLEIGTFRFHRFDRSFSLETSVSSMQVVIVPERNEFCFQVGCRPKQQLVQTLSSDGSN